MADNPIITDEELRRTLSLTKDQEQELEDLLQKIRDGYPITSAIRQRLLELLAKQPSQIDARLKIKGKFLGVDFGK